MLKLKNSEKHDCFICTQKNFPTNESLIQHLSRDHKKNLEKKKKCGRRMFALYFVICRLLLGLFSVFGGLVGNKEHARQDPECPPHKKRWSWTNYNKMTRGEVLPSTVDCQSWLYCSEKLIVMGLPVKGSSPQELELSKFQLDVMRRGEKELNLKVLMSKGSYILLGPNCLRICESCPKPK